MTEETMLALTALRSGACDQDLDAIADLLNARRNVVEALALAELLPGDPVVFTDEKWKGITAEYLGPKGKRASVRLTIEMPRQIGRRVVRPGQLWTVPASFIQPYIKGTIGDPVAL